METILKKEDQKKKIIIEEIDNGDPTMRIILCAVYEKKDNDNNNREWLTVDGFTPYDNEGRYLGNEEFPIYHAIVTYPSDFRYNDGKTTTTVIIERPNLRLAVDYIANEFKKTGVNLTKNDK